MIEVILLLAAACGIILLSFYFGYRYGRDVERWANNQEHGHRH